MSWSLNVLLWVIAVGFGVLYMLLRFLGVGVYAWISLICEVAVEEDA